MKSDLTCPVEIIGVEVHRESEPEGDLGRILCLIDFINLADREVSSIQMNIICFDAEDHRLGGRLVRAGVHGEAKAAFTGSFVPEHVEGAARVEASVEKVWYSDGVLWRREEKNVREYEPNLLPEGRELDRLRACAGPDARGYAREDDSVWMCVCGRANRTSEDLCMRCGRKRSFVMEQYSFDAVDKTAGRKERNLEQRSLETVRRSSEQSAWDAEQKQKKQTKRRRRTVRIITLLALAAALLAGWRWALPAVLCRLGETKLAEGRAGDAKALFDRVSAGWPGLYAAEEKALEAQRAIIDGLITEGTDESLQLAEQKAEEAGDEARRKEALLARASLLESNGDLEGAEKLLRSLAGIREAEEELCRLVYARAEDSQKKLDYPLAIEQFASLGAYRDAGNRLTECVYLFGRQLLREGKYSEACKQLESIAGYQDSLSLLRSARYGLAALHEKEGETQEAAQLFESLGIYEDAQSRAKACRYAAGKTALDAGDEETAAEQFSLAEDYEDAVELFTKTAQGLADTAIKEEDWQTAIGWLAQMPRNEETGAKLNLAVYAWAENLLAEGRREEAAVEFASLGDYSDSRDRANALEYAIATEEMAKSPEEAMGRFEALGSYKDAREKAQDCRRAWAEQLYLNHAYEQSLSVYLTLTGDKEADGQIRRCRYAMANECFTAGEYEKAAELYAQCGTYLDAEEGVLKAKYALAAQLEADGSYQEAAAAFHALGAYNDAKLAVIRCEDEWLRDRWTEAQMDADLGNYAGVITALKPVWQQKLPLRYGDIPKLYEDACLGLAQELIGLGRPLDALPYLEEIPQNRTAKKRLNDYVYRVVGRWKETRGTEFVFRRDGSCSIAGKEGYFGGSGYELYIGEEPYPRSAAYSVVSIRGTTLTLKDKASGKNLRLTYLGEPTEAGTSDAGEAPATPEEETGAE